MAKALMIQGTGSNVGKSLIVAGLCRFLSNEGYKVLPFKPQNMSNNAAVCVGGGEVGRAQALQALACRAPLCTDMNPILLKPQSEMGSQLIVNGQVRGNYNAREYQEVKATLMGEVLAAYERLKERADFVIVEGAGSSSEVNLKKHDIANMGFALKANIPVILAADISRGGVIASLVGAHKLMSKQERALTKGYIINRFMGDKSIFYPAFEIIEKYTGFNSYGILPHIDELSLLPQEDSVALEDIMSVESKLRSEKDTNHRENKIKVTILCLKTISNFDDFDPLLAEDALEVSFIKKGQYIPADSDVIILPGNKSTISALRELKVEGFDIDILAHKRRGGKIFAICAGFQMLGDEIMDKDGIEGDIGSEEGLGLFKMRTLFSNSKSLEEVRGQMFDGTEYDGYKMHMGVSEIYDDNAKNLLKYGDGLKDGLISEDGNIIGTYIHGIFHNDEFRSWFLNWASGCKVSDSNISYKKTVDDTLDFLAKKMEHHLHLRELINVSK